jgi:hypothetical protein
MLCSSHPARAGRPDATDPDLAMVLLSGAGLPSASAIQRAFAVYAPKGQTLHLKQDASKPGPGGGEGFVFESNGGGEFVLVLMREPMPAGQAEEAVRHSVSALFNQQWSLPKYKAHIVVTAPDAGDPRRRLEVFTALVAAVVDTSHALGVVWPHAGATHEPKYFLKVAKAHELVSSMTIWCGFDLKRGAAGKLDFLSRGMERLSLPNLLLVVPSAQEEESVPLMFDLLAYVAERGKPLPEGDTVGRDDQQRLPVHYVPSPVNPTVKVMRVELK